MHFGSHEKWRVTTQELRSGVPVGIPQASDCIATVNHLIRKLTQVYELSTEASCILRRQHKITLLYSDNIGVTISLRQLEDAQEGEILQTLEKMREAQ